MTPHTHRLQMVQTNDEGQGPEYYYIECVTCLMSWLVNVDKLTPRRSFYTIQAKDVGKPILLAFGRTWMVGDHWGRTLPTDVGKRAYYTAPNVLQIENDEQQATRSR